MNLINERNPVKRHFALPASIAAMLHALLLFGFAKKPVPAVPPQVQPKTIVEQICVTTPPGEIPDTDGEGDMSLERPINDRLTPPEGLKNDLRIELPTWPRSDLRNDGRVVFDSRPEAAMEGIDLKHFPGVLSADLLDNPPLARTQPSPVYPLRARQEGRDGEVIVEFIVDEYGTVHRPRIVRSSDLQFEESTLNAVAKWRFVPGRKNDRPVSFRMVVPVRFRVDDRRS